MKYTLINTKTGEYLHKRCQTSGFGILFIKNPTTKNPLDIKTWTRERDAKHYLSSYINGTIHFVQTYDQKENPAFYTKIKSWLTWFETNYSFEITTIS